SISYKKPWPKHHPSHYHNSVCTQIHCSDIVINAINSSRSKPTRANLLDVIGYECKSKFIKSIPALVHRCRMFH
ncbi:hypothetical protein TorRG33x02_034690, partial [Trema orientale]